MVIDGRPLLISLCMCLAIARGAFAENVPAAMSPGEGAIVGEWWTHRKDGRIRFYRHRDGTFRGVLAWSNNPRPDTENENPKLRSRSIVGIILIWKLRYKDGEYEDGYVYNPEDGNVYRFSAKVMGRDTLKIRGYLGIPLLSESHTWTRYR